MDIGRYARRSADRGDRPHMVEMTVREQHRGGLQPVLSQDLLDPRLGVLARIDDDALLAGSGRDNLTVGGERPSWEPCDEHNRPFSRYGVSRYRGGPHSGEPITKGTGPAIRKVRFANDRELCGVPGGFPEASPGHAYGSGYTGSRPASREYQR